MNYQKLQGNWKNCKNSRPSILKEIINLNNKNKKNKMILEMSKQDFKKQKIL